jgi:DNA repair exonuclease SbcCD ATPase subunit
MNDKEKLPEKWQVMKPEEMNLEEVQLAEQLYNSAGLDPVVDAGLKDYDKRIQNENKLLSKVLGPRESDIRGYGESVAKRVAFAVYALLNKQYGGKVGDLRSYIMTLQDERDRANTRYDELMGRVVGILGEEYKELRTDSKVFMEKLTTVLGEDLKESKIDQKALADKLADIDGLRVQIQKLEKEKEQQKEGYESDIENLNKEHDKKTADLEARIAELNSSIETLESEKSAVTNELTQLKEDYDRLANAVAALPETIPHEEIGQELGKELHDFILKDSRVPDMVIEGVGKFIDFRKYLGMAAKKGSEQAGERAEQILRDALKAQPEP